MEPSAAIHHHHPLSAVRNAQEHSQICISPHPWLKRKKMCCFIKVLVSSGTHCIPYTAGFLSVAPAAPHWCVSHLQWRSSAPVSASWSPVVPQGPSPWFTHWRCTAVAGWQSSWLVCPTLWEKFWPKLLEFMQPKSSRRWSVWSIWFSVMPGLKSWRDLPDMSAKEHSLGFILTSHWASSPAQRAKITIYIS